MKPLFTFLTLCSLGAFAVGCAPKDQGPEPGPVTPSPDMEAGSNMSPAAPEQPAEPMSDDMDAEMPPPAAQPAPAAATEPAATEPAPEPASESATDAASAKE